MLTLFHPTPSPLRLSPPTHKLFAGAFPVSTTSPLLSAAGNHCSAPLSIPPATMDAPVAADSTGAPALRLLFVEMGVGYDQHGQDITKAAMKACRDAISSNSIPAFRRGSIPGVNSDQMKLMIKLAVPPSVQHLLDIEKVKSVFPYGKILDVEVMDGGMICSSGVFLEAMGDQNEDCYVVNAAVYVGY